MERRGDDGAPTMWARLSLVVLAASLVAVMVDRVVTDAPGDAIHEAVSQGRPAPAPAFDGGVLTAGDLGAAPRRWWRVARNGRVSLTELRGLRSSSTSGQDDSPCLPCRLRAADPEHQETMAGVAGSTLQPRRLLPTRSDRGVAAAVAG